MRLNPFNPGSVNVGKTDKCQFKRALKEAEDMAEKLNASLFTDSRQSAANS